MRLKSFNRLNAFSMPPAQPVETLAEAEGLFPVAAIWNDRLGSALIQFLAQFGAVVCLVAKHPFRRLYSADQALRDRAIMRFASSQQDGEKAPFSICECVYLRVAPSARAANSLLLLPPFPPAAERCAFTSVSRSSVCLWISVSSKLRNRFSQTPRRPAHKAIIDRCRRSILGRAIAPATAAFQNMHDAADDAAVVRPLDRPVHPSADAVRSVPLLVAQPKQVPAHNPDPLPTTIRIALSERKN